MTEPAGLDPVADSLLCGLLLKGLAGPLDDQQTARLHTLIAATPDGEMRAALFVEQWMMAGIVKPETFDRNAVDESEIPATPTEDDTTAQPRSRRWLIAIALATLCVLPLGYALLDRDGVQIVEASPDVALHHQLADGSHIILSRGGRMEVRMDDHSRAIRLINGEAFYHVAKDARRPFTVTVDTYRLTALGTQFNVDPDRQGLRVDLLEGSLLVESTARQGKPIILAAGQRFDAGTIPQILPANSQAASWGEGRLVFDDAPLSEVSAQLARHSDTTLRFTSPQVAVLRFSGVLRFDQPADWKPALETVLPVAVTPTSTGYSLTYRPG